MKHIINTTISHLFVTPARSEAFTREVVDIVDSAAATVGMFGG